MARTHRLAGHRLRIGEHGQYALVEQFLRLPVVASELLTGGSTTTSDAFGYAGFLRHARVCRRSVIYITNIEVSGWGCVLGDKNMAAALIDRTVHHGRLIRFEGRSYCNQHALMTR